MAKKYKVEVYEMKNIPYETPDKCNYGFTIDINKYLHKLGRRIVFPSHPMEEEDIEISVYHVDAATVLLTEISLDNSFNVQIELVSKDKLDDVVNKILEKFPDFKRTK